METNELIPHLDFANHHPSATTADIQFICRKVTEFGFNAAFMNPSWIVPARHQFGFLGKIGTIVSFPLGQDTIDIKIASARRCAEDGANELDTVLNISLIKEGRWELVYQEMQALVDGVKSQYPQVIIKCIPECGFLEPNEIKKLAPLMIQAKVDFFKTCTGMGPRGATLDDVKYVKEAVGDQIKIKVAGGIDTREEAEAFLASGAVRIGTSHALDIIGAAASSVVTPPTASTE